MELPEGRLKSGKPESHDIFSNEMYPFSATRDLTSASALVVDPSHPDASFFATALTSAGFRVTVVESFQEARRRLASHAPTLLITETRLEAYNGLHLVVWLESLPARTVTIVTSHIADHFLQMEAERLGATFVVKPITRADFLAAVYRTLTRRPGESPIRPPFERRMRERRASDSAYVPDRRLADRRRDAAVLIEQSSRRP